MDLNEFYNYAARILRPQNTEIGEPYLKNVGEKPQDNNEPILQNTIKTKQNIWYDAGVCPPLPGKLEIFTWTNFNPIPFLEEIT